MFLLFDPSYFFLMRKDVHRVFLPQGCGSGYLKIFDKRKNLPKTVVRYGLEPKENIKIKIYSNINKEKLLSQRA